MDRRDFIRYSAFGTGAAALSVAAPVTVLANSGRRSVKSGFTMWQIPSHKNTIGNSYVFRTSDGKVIVMDGGFAEEENTLRGFIGALGNEVEDWFISHPHRDHAGALCSILKSPQDLKIKRVVHSRMSERTIAVADTDGVAFASEFYALLDKTGTEVCDVREPGRVFQYGRMNLKILGVANDYTVNPINNSSMIMRVWDKGKSIVFLGDAGVECGQKVLESEYRSDLDCDYLQIAHHGQDGCSEEFYRSIRFRACLWSTPLWVWNNDLGKGFDTGHLKTVRTRAWMDSIGIREHHVSCIDGLFRLD